MRCRSSITPRIFTDVESASVEPASSMDGNVKILTMGGVPKIAASDLSGLSCILFNLNQTLSSDTQSDTILIELWKLSLEIPKHN